MLNRAGAYRRNRDYDAELRHWAPLVRKTALHLMARLPRSVQLDDLVQTGMIGLFEALQGFDPGRGIKFETYAQTRIRGAMIDDLRNVDWAPRSVHRNARLIEDTMAALAQGAREEPDRGRDRAAPPRLSGRLREDALRDIGLHGRRHG